MFRQWGLAKERVPDAILLFRMGDFYEMFGEDAKIAAEALDLALTSRDCGGGRRIPMCGVPHHSIDRYLPRLLDAGYKAAICEQMSDPRLAKGLVDREIIRVITKGTALEEFLLDSRSGNYLLSIARDPARRDRFGLAWVDVSTGEFRAAETAGGRAALVEEIRRLAPAECLLAEPLALELGLERSELGPDPPAITVVQEHVSFATAEQQLCRHFGVDSLRGFGMDGSRAAAEAAAQALRYLRDTRLELAGHVRRIVLRQPEDLLVIDAATQRNLELLRPLRGDGTHGTLIECLDRTRTVLGSRLLRKWVCEPLRSVSRITERLDAVEFLVRHGLTRRDTRDALAAVRDLERLTSKVTTGTAQPRDLAAIRITLEALPGIRGLLDSAALPPLLAAITRRLDPVPEVVGLLEAAIAEEPPPTARDPGLVRAGYDPELDELRSLSAGGRSWIAALEATEREATGIPSLKVGYNQVFGYYIEVTHAHQERVPQRYTRKQTLRNAERYVTPELKEMEEKILSADERALEREYAIFQEVRTEVGRHAERLLATAAAVAELDVLAALAEAAVANDYARPSVTDGSAIRIASGRHPVVERLSAAGGFVPNDTELDCDGVQIAIVTGPNMAGKSTYLRQVALIVLMAQMGSFVPAKEAEIGVVDRIFSRVGAHDDLASGQSTFMVEMTETANILHNATARSLVILDEIGRGTSTFDGLSIAWAVTEYLHDRIGAKTLFATHYHQLNALEEALPRVRNYRVLVREEGDDMVFIRRIVPGATDRSYGIQVGRLAGLPEAVVERAKQVLWGLEGDQIRPLPSVAIVQQETPRFPQPSQLSLFGEPAPDPRLAYLDELERLDPDNMAPLEALVLLHDLCRRLREVGCPKGRPPDG